jgi:predicted PurR-regulated permease PerM
MKDVYHKYGPALFIFILIFIAANIIKPFFITLLTTMIITYLFYPIYVSVRSKIKNENLSAWIMILFILILVIGPITFVISSVVSEIPSVYDAVNDVINSEITAQFIKNISTDFGVIIDLREIAGTILTSIVTYLQNILIFIPGKLIDIALSIFFMFYFFRDGHIIIKKVRYMLPFGLEKSKLVLNEIKTVLDALIYGQVGTGITQGIVATIGYSIIGVDSALFWGVLTMFLSIIPMIGPIFVYLPLGLSLVINSISTGSIPISRGIFVLGYGFLIISSVDNIVKPMLIGDKIKLNPALISLGIIGGLIYFGLVGIVLGPVCLQLLSTLFEIYELKSGFTTSKRIKK